MTNVDHLVVQYNVTDAAIAEIAEEFRDIDASTTVGYKAAVAGIRRTRELRGEIELTRKSLKSDALAFGRKVDKEARRIIDSLLEIETPLKTSKEAVDNAKAEVKRKAEEARLEEERRMLEREREEKDRIEKAEREAKEAKLAEERKVLNAEKEKLELEKEKLEEQIQIEKKERQARLDKEQQERTARLAEEQKQREAEEAELKRRQDEIDKAEAKRKMRESMEANKQREAEEANRREIERLELEKRRQAALPDVDKLRGWIADLRAVPRPHVASPTGIACAGQVARMIDAGAAVVFGFAKELGK